MTFLQCVFETYHKNQVLSEHGAHCLATTQILSWCDAVRNAIYMRIWLSRRRCAFAGAHTVIKGEEMA